MSEEKKSEDTKKEAGASEEKKSADAEAKKEEVKTSEKEEKKVCADGSCKDKCCGGKKVFVWIVVAVIVVAVIALFQMKKDGSSEAKPVSKKVSQKVTEKAMELIEGQLVPPGTEVEITDVKKESGLYRIEITVEGQEVTSYMTKDMTKFIPQLVDMKELEDMKEEGDAQMPAAEVQTKSPKPEVEVFVMSHCPYGTQMEKGILPVMEVLGNKIDAKIKFVDYAMHGEEEVTEQLRQYCIQKNEPQKFAAYLTCFLEAGDAELCDVKTGVKKYLLNQCVTATDAEHKVTELLEDESSWVSGQFPQFNIHKEDNEKYGVQGSPALVINGEMIQSGRDSASLLAAVCSGFEEQPAECETELSSDQPAPGFGDGTDASGASADAGCGV